MMFLEDPFDSTDNTARALGTGGLDEVVGGYFVHLFQRSAEVLRCGIQQDLLCSPASSSTSSGRMQTAASDVWLFGAECLFSLDPSSAWTLLGLAGPQFSQLKQEWTMQGRQQQQQRNRGELAASNLASASNMRALLQGMVGPGGVVEEPLCLEEWKWHEKQQQKAVIAAAAAAQQEWQRQQLERERALVFSSAAAPASAAAAQQQQQAVEKRQPAFSSAAAPAIMAWRYSGSGSAFVGAGCGRYKNNGCSSGDSGGNLSCRLSPLKRVDGAPGQGRDAKSEQGGSASVVEQAHLQVCSRVQREDQKMGAATACYGRNDSDFAAAVKPGEVGESTAAATQQQQEEEEEGKKMAAASSSAAAPAIAPGRSIGSAAASISYGTVDSDIAATVGPGAGEAGGSTAAATQQQQEEEGERVAPASLSAAASTSYGANDSDIAAAVRPGAGEEGGSTAAVTQQQQEEEEEEEGGGTRVAAASSSAAAPAITPGIPLGSAAASTSCGGNGSDIAAAVRPEAGDAGGSAAAT